MELIPLLRLNICGKHMNKYNVRNFMSHVKQIENEQNIKSFLNPTMNYQIVKPKKNITNMINMKLSCATDYSTLIRHPNKTRSLYLQLNRKNNIESNRDYFIEQFVDDC
jgi:hypothetical protein